MNREEAAEKLIEKAEKNLCRVEIIGSELHFYPEAENYPGCEPEKFAKAIKKTEKTRFAYDASDDRVACW